MAKGKSVGKKRQEGKLDRYQEALIWLAKDMRPAYEVYVRVHRLVFGIDPDPDDVAQPWPREDSDDE